MAARGAGADNSPAPLIQKNIQVMEDWKNWRTYVANILAAGGILSLLFAFGDPAPGMTTAEWIGGMFTFLIMSAACFGGLYCFLKMCGKGQEDE